MIEHVVAVVGDEEVVEAVVIVVADGDRGCPPGPQQSGFLGDIGERAVAIVFVKRLVAPGGAPSRRVPLSRNRSIQPSLS